MKRVEIIHIKHSGLLVDARNDLDTRNADIVGGLPAPTLVASSGVMRLPLLRRLRNLSMAFSILHQINRSLNEKPAITQAMSRKLPESGSVIAPEAILVVDIVK